MKYWYLSFVIHSADRPNWFRDYKWTTYIKDVDERVVAGDVVLIGNQENGVFAWGSVLSKGEETENREYRVELSRGNIQRSLIADRIIDKIEEFSTVLKSPKRPFTFLTKQQVRVLRSLLPDPKPPAPVGNHFILGSKVKLDEDLQVEYKDIAVSQIAKEAYEYAVAYARGPGGHTFFGVRDNGKVVGLQLDYSQRNDLRKRIEDKLFTIEPPLLAIEDYTLSFENVIDVHGHPVAEIFVIDLEVKSTGKKHRTAGGKSFHKGFSGRRKV